MQGGGLIDTTQIQAKLVTVAPTHSSRLLGDLAMRLSAVVVLLLGIAITPYVVSAANTAVSNPYLKSMPAALEGPAVDFNDPSFKQAVNELADQFEKNPELLNDALNEFNRAMEEDPSFAQEFQKMVSDPEFMQQIDNMANTFEQESAQEKAQGAIASASESGEESSTATTKKNIKQIEVKASTDRRTNFLTPLPTVGPDEKVKLSQAQLDATVYYLGGLVSPLDHIVSRIVTLGIAAQDRLLPFRQDVDKLKVAIGIVGSKRLYERALYAERFSPLREQIIEAGLKAQHVEQLMPSGLTAAQRDRTTGAEEELVDKFLRGEVTGTIPGSPLSIEQRESLIKEIENLSPAGLTAVIAGLQTVIESDEVKAEIEKKKIEIESALAQLKEHGKLPLRGPSSSRLPASSRERDYDNTYYDPYDDYNDYDSFGSGSPTSSSKVRSKPDDITKEKEAKEHEPKEPKDKQKELDKEQLTDVIDEFIQSPELELITKIGNDTFWFDPEQPYFSKIAQAIETIKFKELSEQIVNIYSRVRKDELTEQRRKKATEKSGNPTKQATAATTPKKTAESEAIQKFKAFLPTLIPGLVKLYYAPCRFLSIGGSTPTPKPDESKGTEEKQAEQTTAHDASKELYYLPGSRNFQEAISSMLNAATQPITRASDSLSNISTQLQALHQAVPSGHETTRTNTEALYQFTQLIEQQVGNADDETNPLRKFYRDTFEPRRQQFEESRKAVVVEAWRKIEKLIKADFDAFLNATRRQTDTEVINAELERLQNKLCTHLLASAQLFVHEGIRIRFAYPSGRLPQKTQGTTDKTYLVHFTGNEATYHFANLFITLVNQVLSQKTVEDLSALAQNMQKSAKFAEKAAEKKKAGWFASLISPITDAVRGTAESAWSSITNLIGGGETKFTPSPITAHLQQQLAAYNELVKLIWTKPDTPPLITEPQGSSEPTLTASNWSTIIKFIAGTGIGGMVLKFFVEKSLRSDIWSKGLSKLASTFPFNMLPWLKGNSDDAKIDTVIKGLGALETNMRTEVAKLKDEKNPSTLLTAARRYIGAQKPAERATALAALLVAAKCQTLALSDDSVNKALLGLRTTKDDEKALLAANSKNLKLVTAVIEWAAVQAIKEAFVTEETVEEASRGLFGSKQVSVKRYYALRSPNPYNITTPKTSQQAKPEESAARAAYNALFLLKDEHQENGETIKALIDAEIPAEGHYDKNFVEQLITTHESLAEIRDQVVIIGNRETEIKHDTVAADKKILIINTNMQDQEPHWIAIKADAIPDDATTLLNLTVRDSANKPEMAREAVNAARWLFAHHAIAAPAQ